MNYSHRQMGWLMIWLFLPAIIALLVAAFFAPERPQIWGGTLLVLATMSLFYCLTVTVERNTLKFAFGIGLIRKTISIADIETAEQVRNPWYCGWGIRWFGKGWLYNVSGLDAVELKLKSGKILRIGTDEPEALLRAIRTNMGMTP